MQDWIAYFSVEPFEDVKEDIRNAELLSATINFSGNTRKQFKATDFIHDYWGEYTTPEISIEEQKERKRAFMEGYKEFLSRKKR